MDGTLARHLPVQETIYALATVTRHTRERGSARRLAMGVFARHHTTWNLQLLTILLSHAKQIQFVLL